MRTPNNNLSRIELLLLTADDVFTDMFFRDWPPHIIWRLRNVNFVLRRIAERYISMSWNPTPYLSHWFPNTARFRMDLDMAKGIIVGSMPYRFFDRHREPSDEISIVVRGRGLMVLGLTMRSAGYDLVRTDRHRGSLSILGESLVNARPRSNLAPIVNEFVFHRIGELGTERRVSITLIRERTMSYVTRMSCSEYGICRYTRP